jgi:glycosyltransferase involved in cell wall biosynthesis
VNVLLWHVHGSWTTAFVQGGHEYHVPVLPDRGPDGRGRARTWDWPDSVHEVRPDEMRDLDVDAVVLQRPREMTSLLREWLGRAPGHDVPALYLEHDTPQGAVNQMVHPAAEHRLPVVHVTHFNDLFWDCGESATRVIEHGVVDPGPRYAGDLPRLGAAINEPARRARVTGTDLLGRFEAAAPVDLFGIGAGALGGYEDLPQDRMHDELARRRVYVHTARWTSLGLSLLEAMHLAMPVVALATTEAVEAVPPGCGVISTDVGVLVDAARAYIEAPAQATEDGRRARRAARARYGLDRFLTEWDQTLADVVAGWGQPLGRTWRAA